MASEIARMLDELMGTHRNEDPTKIKEVTFQDNMVCKYFLAAYCPHELFTNTKYDLGTCAYSHDVRFKDAYEKSSKFGKLGYEEKLEGFLRRLHNEMQNKIRKHNERLELTQGPKRPLDGEQDPERERLVLRMEQLTAQVNEAVDKAERLAIAGELGAMTLAQSEADRYKMERQTAHRLLEQYDNESQGYRGSRMEVCDICGCFVMGDAISRQEEHLIGKLHCGYSQIKATLEEFERKREEDRLRRIAERAIRGGVSKSKSPTSASRKRSRSRSKKRSQSRDRKSSKRDRSRDKNKEEDTNSKLANDEGDNKDKSKDDKEKDDQKDTTEKNSKGDVKEKSRDERDRKRDRDVRRRDSSRDRRDQRSHKDSKSSSRRSRSRSPRDRRSSRRSRSRDHKSSSHHHHTSSRRSRSKDRSSRRDKTDDKSPTKVTAEQPTEQEVVTATEQPSTTNGGIASVVASE